MKKLVTLAKQVIVCSLILSCVVSCTKDDNDKTPSFHDQIDGTWVGVKYELIWVPTGEIYDEEASKQFMYGTDEENDALILERRAYQRYTQLKEGNVNIMGSNPGGGKPYINFEGVMTPKEGVENTYTLHYPCLEEETEENRMYTYLVDQEAVFKDGQMIIRTNIWKDMDIITYYEIDKNGKFE